MSSYWSTGYNADIKIENTGDEIIQNWYLSFDYSNTITNIWNAEIYTNSEGEYTIKNAYWNQDIEVGKSIVFGISGNAAFEGFPKNYKLIGNSADVKDTDYSIEYKVVNDWESGFNGTISVTNNTSDVLEDWLLKFDFNREITEIWNGVIEKHQGNHYVIRNAGYNSNIKTGGNIFVGFNGYNGNKEDEPINYKLYSYKMTDETLKGNKVTFITGEGNIENIPEEQIVNYGDYVIKPKNPIKEGHIFIGWYTDESFSESFDFANNVVNEDITLYARWLDYLCEVDTDEDGIVDSLEEFIGTDLNNKDTDKDGLSDYQELYKIGTNPLTIDTDGNGIDDYNDDMDNDGIVNGEEILYNTNAGYNDSDIDGLSDYDEINIYFTDPALWDTDKDGASDGWEIAKGYNPLLADKKFLLTQSNGIINEANPVVAKVKLEAYDADVESLYISKVHSYDNPFISPSIAGYLGNAYDFSLDGKFDTAELIFEYDENLGQLSDEFQPRIYYFNEETLMFEELENQIVENGKVTAITTHFSTYILLNKVEFDKVWNNEIKAASEDTNLNIAFVVDLSGSMMGIKLQNTKAAINSFIDVLDDTDKAALISFANSAMLRCNMTNNKDILKMQVNNMYARGGTAIYKGIEKALEVFKNNEMTGYNMMIVFTDGYDEPSTDYDIHYKGLVEQAKENNIVIYTIGIETINESLLKRVSEATEGSYYYASVISELQERLDEIKEETIDYTTDSNNDGISDYHTKLIKEGKLVLSNSSDELKGIDLNYDENGNLTDDCDGDGLKNGEEIKVIKSGGQTYLKMYSHPLRVHSDGDGIDDYTEVKNGSNPLEYSLLKSDVDRVFMNGNDYFENFAINFHNDSFAIGLMNASSIVNGLWNKTELYRELIIDYYSTYITEDTINNAAFEEEKKLWYDTLTEFISNVNDYGKTTYDTVYNINKLINYVNGAKTAYYLEKGFINDVTSFIVDFNKLYVDGSELRCHVNTPEIPFVKKYFDSDIVKKHVGSSVTKLDKLSNGLQYISYGTDIIDTVKNLSKLQANINVFNENMDMLNFIGGCSKDENVRVAAKNVRDMIAGKYLDVYEEAIWDDIVESGKDVLLNVVAEYVGYVPVLLAVRDIMNLLLGTNDDLQQMYRMLGYSYMCKTYSKMATGINWNKGGYYNYIKSTEKNISRYMINMAQLRILGEQEYYKYIENEGLISYVASWFEGVPELTDGINGLKRIINQSILEIKSISDLLNLKLSSRINYLIK